MRALAATGPSDWLLLDCELLPWNVKAEGLLRSQYASVAAAGRSDLTAREAVLARAGSRGLDVAEMFEQTTVRAASIERFGEAYRRYVWPTNGLDGVTIAPFQTTPSSKPPLIESLALAFERAEAQWQDDPVWTGELEAYERTVSPVTGRSRYNAPDGMHDDCVMSLALAWHGVAHHMPMPATQPTKVNPFGATRSAGRWSV